MLPTSNAILLLKWIVLWLKEDKKPLMNVTIGSFLCKVHYSYFSSSKDMVLIQLLEDLAVYSKLRIEELRNVTATNLELFRLIDIELNDSY